MTASRQQGSAAGRIGRLWTLVMLTPALAAQATGSAVAPGLGQGGVANSSSAYPWAARSTSCRVQQIYDPSEMPAFPVTITALRFRPFDEAAATASWTGGTYGGVTVSLSTAAVAWDRLSPAFASNHGQDQARVFAGSVTLSPGSGTGIGTPSRPYVVIRLATPFRYDPSRGPLLVDIGTDGGRYTGGTSYPGAVSNRVHKAARVFSTQSHTAPNGTVQSGVGLVMEFDYRISGTFPAFRADRQLVPTGLPIRFTDLSRTSATGGITAYSWDLDGNGTFGDATVPNPIHAYTSAGTYSVALRVVSGAGTFTATRRSYIRVVDPVASVPDLLQYQFNETRDPWVANSASGTRAPRQGRVTGAGWHGQAKSQAFGPNEKGFGMMKFSASNNVNWVNTGHSMQHSGSLSIAWWQRMDPKAPSNAFAYAWGGASGSNFRCFNRGAAIGSISCSGNPVLGTLDAGIPIHHSRWVHLALVIDDTNGRATWFVDGVAGNSKTFTAGTFTESHTDFQIGKYGSSTATLARYYSFDDFRVYGRALSPAEVLGLMTGEGASVGNFGRACVSQGSVPRIVGGGGRPQLGNSGFRAEMNGAPAQAPYALVLGFVAGPAQNLPVDLAPVFGSGCLLETQVFRLQLGQTSGAGVAVMPLPVPNNPQFIGLHAYLQGAFLTATARGTTDLLDINIQR